jgi:hypothetical protein
MQRIILLAVALFLNAVAMPLEAQQVSKKSLKKHISYLASDRLLGRGTGTAEERMAADYLAKQFKKMGLTPKGDDGTFFHNFKLRRSSDPHGMNHDMPEQDSRNVVAYLDNGAPYTIVIGAHYDHLGLGHDHNSLDANPEGKIHNGADDNASGTAAVLELARYFAKNKVKEQHNFLFLCFSGEELGLVGSKKFTERPTIDLSTVSFMLNMDMVGRLNAEKTLVLGGVGTSPSFVPLVNNLSTTLKIKQDSSGMGPSDHSSFYLKNIPVLFAFTGQHMDYHKPSDDADLINYAGEVMVLEYLTQLIEKLDVTPKLTFQETKNKSNDTPSFKVTMGIMPDYTYEGKGVKVDGVTDGKPAAKAGVQRGDVIVGLGSLEVPDIQAYMKGLASHKKGDQTTVRVKRGAEEKVLDVTF